MAERVTLVRPEALAIQAVAHGSVAATEEPLRQGLAERAKIPPEQVVLGNGSVKLTWLMAQAALRTGDGVTIVGPTFGEYALPMHAQLGVHASSTAPREPRACIERFRQSQSM